MKRVFNGVEYEGTPEELAQFEALSGTQFTRPSLDLKVPRVQVKEPSPVFKFAFDEIEKQRLIFSFGEETVNDMMQAIEMYHDGRTTSMAQAMEKNGFKNQHGNEYRLFRKMYRLLYGDFPVKVKVTPDFASASEYFHDNPVSIFHALEKFGISAGKQGYEGLRAEVRKRYPQDAEQLFKIRSRLSQRSFSSDEIEPFVPRVSSVQKIERPDIPEEYRKACEYFMQNRVSIFFTVMRFKLPKSPKGYKEFKRYLRQMYPADATATLRERLHVHPSRKGKHISKKMKPTDLRPARARFVGTKVGELIAQGKTRKEAFVEADKMWLKEKQRMNGQQQLPKQGQGVQSNSAPSAPSSFPLLSPISPDEAHIVEEQVKFIIKEGFALKKENFETLKLIEGTWSDSAWNRFLQSFLVSSGEISSYLGIPNKFRMMIEDGEKVMRYVGNGA